MQGAQQRQIMLQSGACGLYSDLAKVNTALTSVHQQLTSLSVLIVCKCFSEAVKICMSGREITCVLVQVDCPVICCQLLCKEIMPRS